jgi:uncharacterized surface protein with fasciclin (FAS1) repeats
MHKKLVALVAVSAMALAACGGSADEEVVDDVFGETETTEVIAEDDGTDDIVTIAASTEGFSTLVAALDAAGLVDTLMGEGPFTVFAPTDDAFAALDPALLEKLLLPENIEVLTAILTYHVVAGKVMAADVADGEAATLEGSAITLSTSMGVMVNDATVTTADIVGSNGVIHVIDKVLVPPTVDLSSL